mgnify:CR=1 FL=1
MRPFLTLVFLCCAATAAHAADHPQQFARLGDFHLQNGEVIRDCRLGYRTFGTLNAARSNAVLFPTWFSGTSADLAGMLDSGALGNQNDYVIAVDALGDGVSSSPSNSRRQPRLRFPHFTVADMVAAEHLMLERTFGIHHLKAVLGISMGGMQTFQWVVSYPDFMDHAIPIVGSPRLTSYDRLLWETERQIIRESAAWQHGQYHQPPVIRALGDLHNLNLTTPAYRVAHTSPAEFPAFLHTLEDQPQRFDLNDWLWQLDAMLSMDVSAPFGGDLARAAAVVRTDLLVVPSRQDHMVNPTPALEFARLTHAHLLELTGDCGHLANGCEADKLNPAVAAVLGK